jgi:hypothetical protein
MRRKREKIYRRIDETIDISNENWMVICHSYSLAREKINIIYLFILYCHIWKQRFCKCIALWCIDLFHSELLFKWWLPIDFFRLNNCNLRFNVINWCAWWILRAMKVTGKSCQMIGLIHMDIGQALKPSKIDLNLRKRPKTKSETPFSHLRRSTDRTHTLFVTLETTRDFVVLRVL